MPDHLLVAKVFCGNQFQILSRILRCKLRYTNLIKIHSVFECQEYKWLLQLYFTTLKYIIYITFLLGKPNGGVFMHNHVFNNSQASRLSSMQYSCSSSQYIFYVFDRASGIGVRCQTFLLYIFSSQYIENNSRALQPVQMPFSLIHYWKSSIRCLTYTSGIL